MPRLGISSFPDPSALYCIAILDPPPPDRRGRPRKGFETEKLSAEEDPHRAERLAKARNAPGLFRAWSALKLARKLRRRRRPRTPASSRYMRDWRIRLIGAVWKLINDSPWDPATAGNVGVFSAVNRTWTFTPAELRRVDAARLMQNFRTDLNRAGAVTADGFLIGFLHGEWEPNEGVYRLHVHGVAAGGMIAVIDALRQRKSYRHYPDGAVKDAIKVSRKPLEHLPFAISYQFKSYWPERWIGWSDKAGKVVRERRGRQIKEPHHSQVLLWLDRWSLEDMSLLMKVRVGRDGFVLAGQLSEAKGGTIVKR